MHISMCINATLRGCPDLKVGFLVVLDRLMSICERHDAGSALVMVISNLLPGRAHGCDCPTHPKPIHVC